MLFSKHFIFFIFFLHLSSVGLTSDGYLRADGRPPGSRDYEEHLYVNTQNLDNMEASMDSQGGHRPESPKKDIFDMSESAANDWYWFILRRVMHKTHLILQNVLFLTSQGHLRTLCVYMRLVEFAYWRTSGRVPRDAGPPSHPQRTSSGGRCGTTAAWAAGTQRICWAEMEISWCGTAPLTQANMCWLGCNVGFPNICCWWIPKESWVTFQAQF